MLYVLSSSTKELLTTSNLPYSDLTLEKSLAARGLNIPSNLVLQQFLGVSRENKNNVFQSCLGPGVGLYLKQIYKIMYIEYVISWKT